MNHDDDNHDLVHELAERILACVDDFVTEKGSKDATLPLILLATEIPASVSRHLCREAGMLKEGVEGLQEQAEACASNYYEPRAKLMKQKRKKPSKKAVKAAKPAADDNFVIVPQGSFLIVPDGNFQH